MVYSNRGHGPEKTTKYEIYKSVVNDMNRGRYVTSTSSDSRVVPAVLTKDGKLFVSLLNSSDEPIAVQIKLPENTTVRGTMETRLWESSQNDVAPRVSRTDSFNNQNSWTIDVPPQSLIHAAFDATIEKK